MQEIQQTQEKKNRKGMTKKEYIEYRRIYRTNWERTKRHRLKQEGLIQQETSSDVDSVDNSNIPVEISDDNSVNSVDSVHSTHSVHSVDSVHSTHSVHSMDSVHSVDSVDSVHSTHSVDSVDSVQNAYIVQTRKQLIKVIECKNCRSKYIKRKPLRKASW